MISMEERFSNSEMYFLFFMNKFREGTYSVFRGQTSSAITIFAKRRPL